MQVAREGGKDAAGDAGAVGQSEQAEVESHDGGGKAKEEKEEKEAAGRKAAEESSSTDEDESEEFKALWERVEKVLAEYHLSRFAMVACKRYRVL